MDYRKPNAAICASKNGHAQILLSLPLAPHVRVSDLDSKLEVTTEPVAPADIAELSAQGLLAKILGAGPPSRTGGAKAAWTNVQREHVV